MFALTSFINVPSVTREAQYTGTNKNILTIKNVNKIRLLSPIKKHKFFKNPLTHTSFLLGLINL